jgi:hypothetical protein
LYPQIEVALNRHTTHLLARPIQVSTWEWRTSRYFTDPSTAAASCGSCHFDPIE